MMALRVLKFPLKILALAAALCLLLVHLACNLVLGLSSVFTGALAWLFIFGSVGEWLAGMGDTVAYQSLGIGLALLIVPHLCEQIFDHLVDFLYSILTFALRQ